MDADEAAATGAHRDEVDPGDLATASLGVKPRHRGTTYEELQVPGGTTDPLWYLTARHLCPKNMNHTDRLRWIEGFVFCCELLRGVNVDLPGVTEVLRETISLQTDPDLLLG